MVKNGDSRHLDEMVSVTRHPNKLAVPRSELCSTAGENVGMLCK